MLISHPENLSADAHFEEGDNSASLWWSAVPEVAGETVATIGNCQLGCEESAPDFLRKLLSWSKAHNGSTVIFGPMDGNTWRSHRAVTYSDQRPPFLMEPNTPASWPAIFEAAGFAPYSAYSSSTVDLTIEQPDFSKLEKRLEDAGVQLRCINMENFEDELRSIFQLSLQSFQHNVLYTPITEAEFMSKYLEAKQMVDPDLVQLAIDGEEIVGFMFAFPDPIALKSENNPAVIMKTLATKLDRKYSGLGSLLVNRVHEAASRKGIQQAYHALQHESNKSQRLSERFKPTVFRRYTLYAARP
ncbi:hypothetical protein Rhal01_00193 [Rubritalea halochordaticola]|uniref:N-acetyltransferase domain-containing protein n=1 Tax=Rubritalea halochordaticola TaxID=714537 RepID=A0ABP9UV07_9BACT